MIIDNLVLQGAEILKKNNIESYKIDSEILLTLVTKKNREQNITSGRNFIKKSSVSNYLKLIDRRVKKEPVAYILKKKEFWSNNFYVDQNVLIPRPDTEVILSDFEKRFSKNTKYNILDIGTGSGCILLSLLKEFKNFKGIGLDKSIKAINIAKLNSKKLALNDRVKFINCDIDNYNFTQYYDVIVSNPPYISTHKIKNLGEDIRKFEPIAALDGGITGLELIRKVINKAKRSLKINGFLYLEIGYDQSKKVKNMLENNNFRIIKSIKDYGNKIRCIIGTRLK